MLSSGSAVWRRLIAVCAPCVVRQNTYVSSTNWVGGCWKRMPVGSWAR